MSIRFKTILGIFTVLMRYGFSTFPESQQVTRTEPEYTIELLVLYDTGVKLHYGLKISDYIQTLVDVTNDAYRHESLDISLKIVLKKTIHFHGGIVEYRNPSSSLNNFKQELVRRRNTVKFDLGVYLTKQEFGEVKQVGYAPMNSMCQKNCAGILLKDNGFLSGFILAHEIGHTLGMEHDFEKNVCSDPEDQAQIMSATVRSTFDNYRWSSCSRQELHDNIPDFDCLRPDVPPQKLKKSKSEIDLSSQKFQQLENSRKMPIKIKIDETRADYPGSLWSKAEQCNARRANSKVCLPTKIEWNECKQLCCGGDWPRWHDIGAPLAGTSCGKNGDKWCKNGECVAKYYHKGVFVNDVDKWLISKRSPRKITNSFRKHVNRKHTYKRNQKNTKRKKTRYLNRQIVNFTPGMKHIKIVFENWKNAVLVIRSFDKTYVSPKLKRKQFSSTSLKSFKHMIGDSLWNYKVTKHRITITAKGPIDVGATAVLKIKTKRYKYEKRHFKYEFWYKPQ